MSAMPGWPPGQIAISSSPSPRANWRQQFEKWSRSAPRSASATIKSWLKREIIKPMSEIAFVTPHEQEIYRQYNDQRRLRLANVVASASSMLSILLAFTLTTSLLFQIGSLNPFTLLGTIVSWLDIGCYGLGVIAARHGRANMAALCVCCGAMFTIVIMLVYSLVTVGFTLLSLELLLCLPLVVVIAGVLGNTPLLIAITTVSTLGGCAVLVFTAHASVLGQSIFGTMVLLVMVLITPGVMLVIFQQGYQQTLRELGDIRIAYENHELRNPVMAMMGHLDILDMSLATASRERLQRATQGAIRAAERLRTLLTSILDASRLEQGPGGFTPERVPLAQAIQTAAQLIDPQEGNLVERELRVRVPRELGIWGEPIRLQQILTNLFSNALKYSTHTTPIEVTARIIIEPVPTSSWRRRAAPAAPRKLVEITVRDWGLGIPPEQIPLLFQRFVRLPRDLASTVIGNGLGLYVCRICAEAMGGRIWVESSGVEGEGSAFHLWLPLPPSTEGM